LARELSYIAVLLPGVFAVSADLPPKRTALREEEDGAAFFAKISLFQEIKLRVAYHFNFG
jgi:hypothetical protein